MWYREERKQQLDYDSFQCNFTAQCPPMNQTCVKSFFVCNDFGLEHTLWPLLTMALLLLMRTVQSKVFCITPMKNELSQLKICYYVRLKFDIIYFGNIVINELTSQDCLSSLSYEIMKRDIVYMLVDLLIATRMSQRCEA